MRTAPDAQMCKVPRRRCNARSSWLGCLGAVDMHFGRTSHSGRCDPTQHSQASADVLLPSVCSVLLVRQLPFVP